MFSEKDIAAVVDDASTTPKVFLPGSASDLDEHKPHEKSGQEMLTELLEKSGTNERRQKKLQEERYSKVIPQDVLKTQLLEPFKRITFVTVVILGSVGACAWFPMWRGQWRLRKAFHRHVEGRAIDLMPIIGDETRLPLLEFSRALSIDLAGRKTKAAAAAAAAENKAKTTTTTDDAASKEDPFAAAAAASAVAPPPKFRNTLAYQIDEVEARDDAIAAEQAKADKEGREAAEPSQDVSLDMLREACRPDSQLGLSKIRFRAVDIDTAPPSYYDVAFITDALCWEDASVAKGRLRHAWSLVKPGGCLFIADFGRPRGKMLGEFTDWVEKQKVTSFRLTLDYEKFMKESFGEEAEWPAELNSRTLMGFRYTMVVRKKKSGEHLEHDDEPEPKSEDKQKTTTKN